MSDSLEDIRHPCPGIRTGSLLFRSVTSLTSASTPCSKWIRDPSVSLFYPFHQGLPLSIRPVPIGDEKNLAPSPGLLFSDEPGRKDTGVVDDQEVTRVKVLENLLKRPMLNRFTLYGEPPLSGKPPSPKGDTGQSGIWEVDNQILLFSYKNTK